MKEVGKLYEQLLSCVEAQDPAVPFYSSATGDVLERGLGAKYWRQNLEQPVLFSPAVQCLLGQMPKRESTVMLEIGPHSVLAAPLRQILSSDRTATAVYQSTLLRGSNALGKIHEAAGELYLLSVPIDFLSVNSPKNVLTDLPAYC